MRPCLVHRIGLRGLDRTGLEYVQSYPVFGKLSDKIIGKANIMFDKSSNLTKFNIIIKLF